LALAVATGADAIVTFNVRDFSAEYCSSLGVEVLTPDDFAAITLHDDPVGVMKALQEIVGRRKLPSVTVGDLLDRWQVPLPRFVDLARDS
jgi:hypothetical protein